jgi:hypothetical protein
LLRLLRGLISYKGWERKKEKEFLNQKQRNLLRLLRGLISYKPSDMDIDSFIDELENTLGCSDGYMKCLEEVKNLKDEIKELKKPSDMSKTTYNVFFFSYDDEGLEFFDDVWSLLESGCRKEDTHVFVDPLGKLTKEEIEENEDGELEEARETSMNGLDYIKLENKHLKTDAKYAKMGGEWTIAELKELVIDLQKREQEYIDVNHSYKEENKKLKEDNLRYVNLPVMTQQQMNLTIDLQKREQEYIDVNHSYKEENKKLKEELDQLKIDLRKEVDFPPFD